MSDLPELLRDIVPAVGSIWEWEPLNPKARQTVIVDEVTWNGEEVWVKASLIEYVGGVTPKRIEGAPTLNELSRWVEAAVLIEPAAILDEHASGKMP